MSRATVAKPRRLPSLKTAIITVVAYVIAVIFLLPYLEMLVTSVRPQHELYALDYLPHHFAWSNLTNMWGAAYGILSSLRVSLEIAAGATVLVLLVALPAAYYTSRHRFRGRGAFLILVLATQMLQPVALIVGIYKEFLGFGLLNINPVWSLILVNAGFNLAFAIWILNAYIGSIPAELEEAAMVDGNGRFGALRRITLPLAMPGVVTALIFTFIAAWNEFISALALTTNGSDYPLTVRLDSFIGQYTVDWQHLFGASVVATIPVFILFALIEGRVVGGLTAGSVKLGDGSQQGAFRIRGFLARGPAVETALGDVLDDAVGDQVPERLPGGDPVAALARGDRERGDLHQRHLAVRQARPGQPVPGPGAADEVRQREQRVDVVPGQDVLERVRTGDEEEVGVGVRGPQVAQRVDRVRRPRPVDVRPADAEPGVRRRRDDRHQVAVLGRRHRPACLLVRLPCRHEDHLVETEVMRHLAAGHEVPVVDGVEGAAHHPEPPAPVVH
jgi:multiple sugar transport system permease protein